MFSCVCVENLVPGEIILRHHKHISRGRLLTKRAEAEARHSPTSLCLQGEYGLVTYILWNSRFSLSDELKRNGTASEGSYECASAGSANCQLLLPSPSEALPCLPLTHIRRRGEWPVFCCCSMTSEYNRSSFRSHVKSCWWDSETHLRVNREHSFWSWKCKQKNTCISHIQF